jgi:predicted dehydrogenase
VEFIAGTYASSARELYGGHPERDLSLARGAITLPHASTYADPSIAGGGQGQTQSTHVAALMLWLTGLRAKEVVAMTESFELGVDLVGSAAIRFEGGALGSLASTGSVIEPDAEALEIRVFGSAGQALLNLHAGRAEMRGLGGTRKVFPPIPVSGRSPERAPANNFVDLVLGRGDNGSPGWVGARAVELIDAMYRAAASRTVATISDADAVAS